MYLLPTQLTHSLKSYNSQLKQHIMKSLSWIYFGEQGLNCTHLIGGAKPRSKMVISVFCASLNWTVHFVIRSVWPYDYSLLAPPPPVPSPHPASRAPWAVRPRAPTVTIPLIPPLLHSEISSQIPRWAREFCTWHKWFLWKHSSPWKSVYKIQTTSSPPPLWH